MSYSNSGGSRRERHQYSKQSPKKESPPLSFKHGYEDARS